MTFKNIGSTRVQSFYKPEKTGWSKPLLRRNLKHVFSSTSFHWTMINPTKVEVQVVLVHRPFPCSWFLYRCCWCPCCSSFSQFPNIRHTCPSNIFGWFFPRKRVLQERVTQNHEQAFASILPMHGASRNVKKIRLEASYSIHICATNLEKHYLHRGYRIL